MSDDAANRQNADAPSGERRPVTALFADMAGFTSISERLGEEGTFALIQPIYDLMAGAVREHGGTIKDFTGDGIMALFGVPDALEDAPLRACRAGLAIQERLAAAAPAIEARHRVRPQMRIGVNSGLAVVTQVRGQGGPATALGDTVNLASRLQALAEPGTVYLSEASQRLVQGLVETTFAGEHTIKGKAEPQRVYRLDAIRPGAARFDAALGRGLSAYVGREREMDVLQRAFAEARKRLRLVDIVAEPGIGKSRLLHEFRQRIGAEQAFVLSGSCSPDGRQTAFLPFIEVVRGSFQVKAGEAEAEIARKLDLGLSTMGLQSPENLGLLLNLLGLDPPEGALAGLDGLLIGLRTRDLLQTMLAERCRQAPVVLLIEDLHWIDGASQETLGRLVDTGAGLGLLILHTRRPEFEPPWRERPAVTELRLPPLPVGDLRRLAESRLGVDTLPESLARRLAEKAEGNALFAEEILSFLTERGVLRVVAGTVEFDAGAVTAAMPVSLQSLLTARVDRLAPTDRALLQAASVIGRRFEPELLSAVSDDPADIDDRLGAMRALDLVHREGATGDYAFKHALVRDALYQSLLTGPRSALHLKIAEEIERRASNRLSEVVETLAHHFGQTNRAGKAFTYLALAGAKSLRVYSFEEAGAQFGAAIALLDANPGCADDREIVEMLSHFALYSNASWQLPLVTATIERFRSSLDRVGDHRHTTVVQHHYVVALLTSGRYREAARAQDDLSAMAARLGDEPAIAYAQTMRIHVSNFLNPGLRGDFDTTASAAMAAVAHVNDPYLQYIVRFAIGLAELFLGRVSAALGRVEEILSIGRKLDDPRSMGWGMILRSYVASLTGDFAQALELSEFGVTMARTPSDIVINQSSVVMALVSLGHPEGKAKLEAFRNRCRDDEALWFVALTDGVWGIALAMQNLGAGIGWIEAAIARAEEAGLKLGVWHRLMLCEIYLQVVSGNGRPSLRFLARNLGTILRTALSVESRVETLVGQVRQNQSFVPDGLFAAQCAMILGLLYKARKKPALALEHLVEAQRISSEFGRTAMLARIESALAELR